VGTAPFLHPLGPDGVDIGRLLQRVGPGRLGSPAGAVRVPRSGPPVASGSVADRKLYLSAPDVGPLEREALLRAFDSGWVAPVGPELDAFEADVAALIGWPGVVAMSSGSAALHLALLTNGVGPGDEVIVSSFTFAASANVVTYCGATPVFVDSDPTSWNLSPELLAAELTDAKARGRLPKAVVVVDLYGQCADYDALVPLCAELGIPVIEDAAEALGATYQNRPAGTLANAGVFSFNGNKVMTTSGGGMLVSPDMACADRVRYLSTQARQPVLHYEHTDIGFNYRLSNLLAAVGRAQLSRLPQMIRRRLEINACYRAAFCDLDGLSFMPIAPGTAWNGWLTCVVFDDRHLRDAVQKALEADQIESRPLWKPMHEQPVFQEHRARTNGVSSHLFAHGLCLPSGSALNDDDIDRVIALVDATVKSRP
jgi:dTDP-4-amino-4,6-dideoxygalactose transaminase